MLGNIFLKTLWEKRKAQLWWALGVFGLGFYIMLFYPSIQAMPELNEILQSMPEALIKSLVGDYLDFVSPAGYVTTELNLTMALLFITFGVVQGAQLLAGEEERGTLDILLANPLSRCRLLLEKSAALAVMLALQVFILWVSIVLGAMAVKMEIGWDKLAALCFMGWLLGIFHGALALGLGAYFGKPGVAGGLSGAVALFGYTLNTMALAIEKLEAWKVLSPFYYYMANDPARNGLALRDVSVLLGCALIFIAVGLWRYERRDLGV